MITLRLGPADTEKAGEIIREGGLVGIPTETVYGLAGDGMSRQAVERIYAIKGRPSLKPLSLMVGSSQALSDYCRDIPQAAYLLAERFWPGPLTIVMKAKPSVPDIIRAGGDTVGLRCPDMPCVLELIQNTRTCLAAPSANISGGPSPTCASMVLAALDGKIDAVIDGGDCRLGRESTIIDLSELPYKILREGALRGEDVLDSLIPGIEIIGITGGSGAGKTTALETLRDMGGLAIDCDAVYHRLLRDSEGLKTALEDAFPGVTNGGIVDRKKLGNIVFADPEALALLDMVTHDFVTAEIRRLLRDWAARGGKLAAMDAIALIESGLGDICDHIVGVLAPRELRIERIMRREGLTKEYARLRVDAQKPDSFFRENCDKILTNQGDASEFKDSCRDYFETLCFPDSP